MIDYHIVGARIRQYRQDRGITQEELAFEINTSAAYISNIERGIKKPSLQKLTEIADYLEVTLNDFIYSSSDTCSTYFDRDFQDIISLCTPEKQQSITKNIAEIIHTRVRFLYGKKMQCTNRSSSNRLSLSKRTI